MYLLTPHSKIQRCKDIACDIVLQGNNTRAFIKISVKSVLSRTLQIFHFVHEPIRRGQVPAHTTHTDHRSLSTISEKLPTLVLIRLLLG